MANHKKYVEQKLRVSDDPNFRQYKDSHIWCNALGKFYRVYPHVDKEVIPYKHYSNGDSSKIPQYVIKVSSKMVTAKKVVWEAFGNELPKGYGLINKNGLKRDVSLHNLEMMKLSEISHKFAGRTYRTRWVKDLDTGKVYKSTYQASKALYLHPSHIAQCCNGMVKSRTNLVYLKERPYGKGDYE